MENSSTGVENSVMNPRVPITQLQQLAVEPACPIQPSGLFYREISVLGTSQVKKDKQRLNDNIVLRKTHPCVNHDAARCSPEGVN